MRTRFLWFLPLFCLACLARAQTSYVVYADGLSNGWQNYSWATVSLAATSPVHAGSNAIAVTAKGFEAVYFHHDALPTAAYQAIRFWLNGGTGGQQLQVNALRLGKGQTTVTLPALEANKWVLFTLPLSDLGVANVSDFDGFWIQNTTGATLATFYVDDVDLTLATPPSTVQLTIQAQTAIRTIDSRLYGVNLAIWDSLLTASQTAPLLTAVKFGVYRIPGGSASDDYDWQTNKQITNSPTWTWANGPGNFAKVTEAQNAQVYVTVNYGNGTPEQAAAWVAYYNGSPSSTQALGTDAKARDWKTVGYWASLRGAAPLATDDGFNHLRISHPAAFGFKYWEVGNECYGTWENDLHGVAGSGLTGEKWDPYTYAQAFNVFRTRMLAVDSTLRIGAVATAGEDEWGIKTHPATNPNNGTQHTGWTPVMLATMKSLGVAPDFLIYHYYAQNSGNESDLTLMQKSSDIPRDAQSLRTRLNDYLGSALATNVELAMTELNSVSSNPGKQTANLVNALFYADAYATAARTEFNTVLWWDLHNGAETNHNNSASLYGWRAFGCYDLIAGNNFPGVAAHTGLPTYQAASLLTYWGRGGDQTVTTTSNYSWLAVHAAKLANGRLALLVINKHPEVDLPAQISVAGFSPGGSATVRSYGKTNDAQGSATPGLSTSTLSNVSSSFNYTFPSYSMTVIELSAGSSTPAITTQPTNQAAPLGGTATFSVTASGTGLLTYQWFKDGVALSGETGATLTVSNVQASQVGTYTVVITNSAGSTTSSGATLALGNPGRLINLSVRSQAGSGSQTLIVGFIISGSGTKPVMVRGSGPTLSNFGVAGVLPDPKLDLFQGSTVIGTNDSWGTAPNLAAIVAAGGDKLGQFTLNAKDTVLLQPLSAGLYTAQVTGVGGSTGVALVEAFDTDPTLPSDPGFSSQPRLINLSARTQVGTGDNILIAGFIINGDVPKRLMIRGIGPTLSQFGVTGLLADPQLQVFSGETIVAQNDDWGTSNNLAEIVAANGDKLGTFTLGAKESVLIVTLPPGPYTAQVRGANNGTGVALVEVYELP